jgi:pimeloyl-ACP methyl ester carboxylesterase
VPRLRTLAVLFAVAVALAAASPASALKTHDCRQSAAFRCATITVPLDRSGAVPGTVKLSVAVERPAAGLSGFLLALSGGPGQPAVAFADSFRASLAPALAHHRLVLIDQRGTGESGALSCPPLQKLGTLDVVNTRIVEGCMDKLGARRRFYSTTDTVLDIDAVRTALGADKLELMGVSYGTYVAAQYARRFPAHTDGLILDSVVGPDGIDPYFLDTFERLPRVLAEQCDHGRCAGATSDPVGDLGKVNARLQRGAIRGTVSGARGGTVRTAIHDESELLLLIMSGDLNPFMQAALPGAINAATRGDDRPLLRMRRLAQGPFTPYKEFSSTLNVATTCADVKLPYTFQAPLGARFDAWQHGADGLAESAFTPFSRRAVVDTSLAHDCLRWPVGDTLTGPSTDPLPDVPALLLSGRLDTRTPVENSRELLPSLPHGQLLTVGGTGHDILDSDITGCAARALRRWAAGRPIGTPCRGKSNAVTVQVRPPLSLDAYRSAPGVGGARGRAVFATLDSIADAQLNALQTLYAGYDPVTAGGLRGGWMAASSTLERLALHGYSYVPGLRLTGSVHGGAQRPSGHLRIDGPGHLDGRLTLRKGEVTGTLGGRRVHYDPRKTPASSSRAGGRAPSRTTLPSLRNAAARARLLHRIS